MTPVALAKAPPASAWLRALWNDHLESIADYANRLPTGRSLVRCGSISDLHVEIGKVSATVRDATLYRVELSVRILEPSAWKALRRRYAGSLGSVIELLQNGVSTEMLKGRSSLAGLLPSGTEIEFECNCLDWARMCSHVCAVVYAVGDLLHKRPDYLLLLRGVDHRDLFPGDMVKAFAAEISNLSDEVGEGDLAEIFGIELFDERKDFSLDEPLETPPAADVTALEQLSDALFSSLSGSSSDGGGSEEDGDRRVGEALARAFDGIDRGRPTGPQIRRVREFMGLDVFDFAAHVGVSAVRVAEWESRRGWLDLSFGVLQGLRSVAGMAKRQTGKTSVESRTDFCAGRAAGVC